MRRLLGTAIAAILVLFSAAACERNPLPTAPTSQPSFATPASQFSHSGMIHPDYRVWGPDGYVVGAVATATWPTGSSTDVSSSPLGKVTFVLPADVTEITIHITADGYCSYHEEHRAVRRSGGWTYLFMPTNC